MRTYDDRPPERIEDDIEYTRTEIGETLGAIERRLSPSRLADRAIGYIRGGPSEFGANLGRQIKAHAVPVALIGIGLAWLIVADQRERRRPSSYGYRPMPDRYRPAAPDRYRRWERASAIEGYDDPYRTYSDEPLEAYEPYEDYDRYEDYEPYEAYDEEDVYAAGRRRGGAAGVYDEPVPGTRLDPLTSAEPEVPPAGPRTETTTEQPRSTSATTTPFRTKEPL